MSNTQQIINELNATIGGFTGKVNAKVQEVNQTTAKIKVTADTTLGEIKRFRTSMIENEQQQSAQESILRINQIIRERFYDYDTIRKTVLGVVKDFDLNLVRNKTIEELSEELWITSSRYWLSYTLIALSAWVNDNKKLADNAVAESFRTDDAKTSLFFCLTNLRFGRIEVARAWLQEYFQTVVPEDLQDEASIMLQSYVNGLFGIDEQLSYEVQKVIDSWIDQIGTDENLSVELINMYASYIQNLTPNNVLSTSYLSKYCTNYNELPKSYNEALKFDLLIKKIKEVDVPSLIQNAANYKKRVDLILKDLVTNYDDEEKELKEQQEYFQLIIDNKGKEEVAQKQFENIMKVRHQKNNFAKKCIQWALYERNADINVQVRKFGFKNTKVWLLDSIRLWSENFENSFPKEYNISFNINSDKKWSCVSNGEDQDEQIASVRDTVEGMKKSIVWDKKVKTRLGFLALSTVLEILVLLLLVINKEPGAFALVLTGLCAVGMIVFFILWFVRWRNGDKRYKATLNEALQKIKGCMSELTEYRRVYFANLAKKGDLFSLIEHL